jgi:DNA-binding NarL/FixJ family response regulator
MAKAEAREIPVELVQFLIVDDHSFVRHIVSECLKANKIKRFIFAQDGSEALQILSFRSPLMMDTSLIEVIGTRPDIAADLFPSAQSFKAAHAYCVVTDFKMDDVNGLQLLKAIRCGETRIPRDTPVILLTGFSDDFVVSTALQLDVNAFVLKPVSNRVLWEKVQRVLKSVSPAKDADAYKDVAIPDEEGQFAVIGGASNYSNQTADDADHSPHLMPLGAVMPGAILARDLHGARGALLLREGTVFTPSVIQKLLDLEQMKALAGEIPIRQPSRK